MFIHHVKKSSSSRGGGGSSRVAVEVIKRATRSATSLDPRFNTKKPISDPSLATSPIFSSNNEKLARAPSPLLVPDSGDGNKINNNIFEWPNLSYDQFPDPPPSVGSDESDGWVSVNNGSEFESCRNGIGISLDLLLATPPSLDEVQTAIASINEAFAPEYDDYDLNNQMITSPTSLTNSVYSSDLEWKEPSMPVWQPHGRELDVPDLGMLRNPLVKEMVIGLSTDKNMWECAKQNEVVCKVKEMFSHDLSKESTKNFISWIFDNTTGKAMEIFKSLTDFINKLFSTQTSTERSKASDPFEKILRSSYMLTIIVFIVVVNNRMHNA